MYNITLKKKWKNGKVIKHFAWQRRYSYPIFNFTVHHYIFYDRENLQKHQLCCKLVTNTLSHPFFLFLSLSHCEIQTQFSSENIFTVFFPFSVNVNVLSPFTPRLFCPYVTINYPVRSFEKCTVHMLRIRCIVPAPTLLKHVPRDCAYSQIMRYLLDTCIQRKIINSRLIGDAQLEKQLLDRYQK